MNKCLFALTAIACAALVGCGVSMNPIYDADALVDPEPLLGIWQNDEYVARVERLDEGKLFVVQVVDVTQSRDDSTKAAIPQGAVLIGGMIKLGDTTYIDLTTDLDRAKALMPHVSATLLLHLMPVHSIAKATVAADAVTLDIMHPGKLRELLAKEPDAVPFAKYVAPGQDDSETVLMTGTPAELRAFLQLSQDKPLWFSNDEHAKPMKFERGKAEVFEQHMKRMEAKP